MITALMNHVSLGLLHYCSNVIYNYKKSLTSALGCITTGPIPSEISVINNGIHFNKNVQNVQLTSFLADFEGILNTHLWLKSYKKDFSRNMCHSKIWAEEMTLLFSLLMLISLKILTAVIFCLLPKTHKTNPGCFIISACLDQKKNF